MKPPLDANQTERINDQNLDLELRDNHAILSALLNSQSCALQAAKAVIPALSLAVTAASKRLSGHSGRLIMIGAGASGRLAVQDGAELWPTYGWPDERLVLRIAGGNAALLKSIEGIEDDARDAQQQVRALQLNQHDVVLGLAASGSSTWTVAFIAQSRQAGALTIGVANNADTPLLNTSEHSLLLDSGEEVLAGSTRMAAGTAQKIVLNMFSTLLMIRLNRTYGNLMVDMAAKNQKLDVRRRRMLKTIHPSVDDVQAYEALHEADGWVKLAALICLGLSREKALSLLESCAGNLREAIVRHQAHHTDTDG